MNALRIIVFALLKVILLSQDIAFAQTCSFSMSNVNFGTVNLLGGGSVDTTATLSYSCSMPLGLLTYVRICPNVNAGSGGSSGSVRTMLSGTNSLSYQLFTDSSRTILWGSVTNTALGGPPSIDLAVTPGTSNSGSYTMYGRIVTGQAATPGGTYLSTFSGGQTRFNYGGYGPLTAATACASLTTNPEQVSFTVNAVVNRTCTVTAQNINFGSHGVISSNVDANGALSVSCTPDLPYTISLNGGLSNAEPTQRRMTLGTNAIIYGLYSNAARSVAWGSAVGQTLSGTGTGSAQNIPVYGRVARQTTPPPGTYSDTVVVTVTY